MKKRISLIICMLAVIISFTACGSGGPDEEEQDAAQMEQVADFMVSYCSGSDDTTFEEWYNTSEFGVDLQLTQSGLPVGGEEFVAAMQSWQAGVEECGAYISHGDYSVKESSGKTELTAEAEFEKRSGTITFMFDSDERLESMTISADMTMGEILKKAGLNTVLGMGTVFIVLILIAFIISLMKYIPIIIEGLSKKKHTPASETEKEEETTAEEAVIPVPVQNIDDKELIAVISAAIAAAEGTDTDGFVVRSIRRRPSNRWNSK